MIPLTGVSLAGGRKTALKAARQKAAATACLAAVLRDGPRSELLTQFDARLIREYPEQFAPYQAELSLWTQSEILPAENLGIGRRRGPGQPGPRR